MRIGILTLAMALGACTADIRPDDAVLGTAEQTRGRALLERAFVAHGGEAWTAHETASLTFRDTWQGLLGRLGNPWPERIVYVRMDVQVAGADLRARFLEGALEGTTWGIQGPTRWTATAAQRPRPTDDELGDFVMPALHYLAELPIRSRQMPLVTALPDREIRGVRYHRVLATWDTFEPNDSDQYIFYIDPETGRVAKSHFTIRAFAGFATSTVHYDDYRAIDGALVAHRLTLTDAPEDDPSDAWFHQVVVEEASFDTVPLIALRPLTPVVGLAARRSAPDGTSGL